MDLVTGTLLVLDYSNRVPTGTAVIFSWIIWTLFLCLPIAGVISDAADKARLRAPICWGVAAALAPPVIVPLFLLVRLLVERADGYSVHSRGRQIRGRSYAVAFIALSIAAILIIGFALSLSAEKPLRVLTSL